MNKNMSQKKSLEKKRKEGMDKNRIHSLQEPRIYCCVFKLICTLLNYSGSHGVVSFKFYVQSSCVKHVTSGNLQVYSQG